MAEEVVFGESNKRKYGESPSPVTRRGTGFSSPPGSAAPPPSYNNVPPPMSEIELAKQKAQEIAARLLNNSDPLKRARVDSGGGFDSSGDYGTQKPLAMAFSGSPQVVSSGYPGPTKKIDIPNSRVGVIIGKGGETIKYLQLQSGAKIQVTRDMDADLNSTTRGVELVGTPDQIAKAEQLINDVLSEAEAGGSGIVSRRLTGQPSGAEQYVMKVPSNKVGLVIGKGGETIKNMQARSGARIQVIPLHLPPGDMSKERTVQIDGTNEQIELAKQLVEEVTSENRVRNSSMSGGYPQQGYQNQPTTNWSQPGPPMQQQSYGYAQAPGPSPQYNMNQTAYSGYPQSVSGGYGYATGWDQSSAQGGSYDYYNQQQQPTQQGTGAPPDGSGYGYSQATGYSQGQGFGQDGCHAGATQTGYGQAQTGAGGSGYDQQQGYGNASNPTSDGHTSSYGTQGETNQASVPGQSYSSGAQPYPNSNYPPPSSTQPGYGVPPTSQGGYGTQTPTSYGSYGPPQSQKAQVPQPAFAQFPSAQGGGYTQSGYPQSQPPPGHPAYPQTDAGSQRPPSLGYPTSQPYTAPPYGVPPATQPGYGQQPPPYTSSYSGGYTQPPAYAPDGSTGGNNARGTYDTTPPQSTQPSGTAKASPSG